MRSGRLSTGLFSVILAGTFAVGQNPAAILAGKLEIPADPTISDRSLVRTPSETMPTAALGVPRDPAQLVTRVEGRHSLEKAMGTGWCLNRECDWVITNYHVVKFTGEHPTVNGVKTAQIVMATSEHDQGAQPIATAIGDLTFTSVRDIALIKLREPLLRTGMHAVPFYTGDLQPGQSVTVLGYPGGKLESISGRFVQECDDGELLFDLSHEVSRGISGGLVLDEQGRAIGLIYGISPKSAKSVYAVPVWSVAEFLHGFNKDVYTSVFGDADNLSSDTDVLKTDALRTESPKSRRDGLSLDSVVPESSLLRNDELTNTPLPRANDEGPEVIALRKKAQVTSDQMDNFIARQTLHFSSGKAWQHELQLVDGVQRFRIIGSGKEIHEMPATRRGPVPGSDWADLVTSFAYDASVALQFERDITVEGNIVKVFRYEMSAEDDICQLRVTRPFRREWKGSPPCVGVIWTDQQFRILRITKDMLVPPDTGLAKFRIVVLYGWWGERLVPVEMYIRSTSKDGSSQASTAKFDNYREFGASSRIIVEQGWWEQKSLHAQAGRVVH